MIKRFCISLIILFFFAGCEEKLPERIEPKKIVVGKLKLANDNPYVTIRWGLTAPYLTTFQLGVQNVFDETLDSYADIEAKLDLFLIDSSRVIRTLEYRNLNVDEVITIDRGETYWVNMVWDQYDNTGRPLYQYINPQTDTVYHSTLSDTLEFKASGEIKVYSSVAKVNAEMDFQVRFIIR